MDEMVADSAELTGPIIYFRNSQPQEVAVSPSGFQNSPGGDDRDKPQSHKQPHEQRTRNEVDDEFHRM